jgi:hypothetical protein
VVSLFLRQLQYDVSNVAPLVRNDRGSEPARGDVARTRDWFLAERLDVLQHEDAAVVVIVLRGGFGHRCLEARHVQRDVRARAVLVLPLFLQVSAARSVTTLEGGGCGGWCVLTL